LAGKQPAFGINHHCLHVYILPYLLFYMQPELVRGCVMQHAGHAWFAATSCCHAATTSKYCLSCDVATTSECFMGCSWQFDQQHASCMVLWWFAGGVAQPAHRQVPRNCARPGEATKGSADSSSGLLTFVNGQLELQY
jgi:hypothetical protein